MVEGFAPGLLAIALALHALSLAPLVLLFFDHRRRKDLHKPIFFILAFVVVIAVVIPSAIALFGIWLVLLVPLGLFAYVLATRRPRLPIREAGSADVAPPGS